MKRKLANKKCHFNGKDYTVVVDVSDPSGEGCIREIIDSNEYALNLYRDCEGKSFIDIGANCGIATVILAKQNPKSTVYAFEPHPPTFELLKRNVTSNGLTNVKLFNLAVSDSSEKTITLTTHPEYSGGNTTSTDPASFDAAFDKRFDHSKIQHIPVKCINLDDICKDNGITDVELLKIDCEGAEYEILYASEFLKSGKITHLAGEFHDVKYYTQSKGTSKELYEYCSQFISGNKRVTFLSI